MTHSRVPAVLFAVVLFVIAASSSLTLAQQSNSANAVVPMLVQFSEVLTGSNGKPLTGITGVTFSLYAEQSGGAPLWLETQNVQPDAAGHYTVQLGAATSQGLPSSLFVSGQARWLEVQAQGQGPQPRVMLMSVPYALKAGDAQTIGGLPPTAFVLAAPPTGGNGSTTASGGPTQNPAPSGASDVTTSGGTPGTIPFFSTATDIENSVITQTGTGSKAKVGINTTSPASTLDIKGSSTVRGTLSLPATKTATAVQGYNSQPIEQSASAYDSGSGTAIAQNFEWQAEPVGNDTANTSATLNLLFSTGSNKFAETGLNIASNGQINFASGQSFPLANGSVTNAMLQNSSLTVNPGGGMSGGGKISLGGSATLGLETCSASQVLEFVSGAWTCTNAATGTITGVTAGTGLSGGGTSGNVTLNNTGILSLTQGSGIQVSSGQTPTISNSGVLSITAGTGIGLSGSGQNPTVSNSGILGLTQGTGISIGSGQNPTVGINTSVVPELSSNNSFTGSNSFSSSTGNGLSASSTASGDSGVFATNSNTTNGYGVFATTSNSPGAGVAALNYGSSGNAEGVYAASYSSTGIGVYGTGNGTGVFGATSPSAALGYGVFGNNTGTYSNGAGVYGQMSTEGQSVVGSTTGNNFAGVWGDGGASGNIGILGTADNNVAGIFQNDYSGCCTLYAETDGSSGSPFMAFNYANTTYCYVDNSGNLNCTGSKHAIVPIDGGSRKVALAAIESPKNWFEDFGSAQLVNGSATVVIDPEYRQTVNTEMDYKVFPVPNGDCNGLYVTHKTATSFEVRELHKGTSSVSFDYRIIALRKNYENIRLADHTNDPDPRKMVEKNRERRRAAPSHPEPVERLTAPARPAPLSLALEAHPEIQPGQRK